VDNRNDENLRELFEKFMDPEQTQMYLDDIEKGEQVLRQHPAPEPDDMLLANIKAEIALHVMPRRAAIVKRIAYRAAVVAAAVIIITAIGTNLFEEPTDIKPGIETYSALLLPTGFWNNDDIAAFNTKVEQIENELMALESGEENLDSDRDSAVTEMEMELIVIAGDFWKG